MEYENEKRSGKRAQKTLLIILIILLFLVCAGGVVYLVWIYYNNYMAQNTYEGIANSYVEEAPVVETLEKNPVDFDSLKAINEDVYAWIKVPNTKIDYPIVQSEITDYYLRRSIYKKYLLAGCIYTNNVNSKDFSDPVTLVYGHNMRNDTMFNMLHEFEDEKFFNDNEFFYIYLPGRKLVFLNGCMADKDYGSMFRWLEPYAQEFVTVTPANPRALSAEALRAYIHEHLNAKATPCATVAEGVRTAIERAGKDGVVCACGSLYMIGEIVAALEQLKD